MIATEVNFLTIFQKIEKVAQTFKANKQVMSVTLFKPTEMINLTLPAAETTFCFENIDRLMQFD